MPNTISYCMLILVVTAKYNQCICASLLESVKWKGMATVVHHEWYILENLETINHWVLESTQVCITLSQSKIACDKFHANAKSSPLFYMLDGTKILLTIKDHSLQEINAFTQKERKIKMAQIHLLGHVLYELVLAKRHAYTCAHMSK